MVRGLVKHETNHKQQVVVFTITSFSTSVRDQRMFLKRTGFLFFYRCILCLSISSVYEQTLWDSQDCIFTHTQRQDPTCYCVTVLSDTLFILRSFGSVGDEGVVFDIVQHNRQIFHLTSTVKGFKDLYICILMRERGRWWERKSESERKKQRSWRDWMEDRKNPTPITQITKTLACNLSSRS